MVKAWTDKYLPILGDWRHDPVFRPVTLTRYDGKKECHAVTQCGTVVKLELKHVFKDQNRNRFKPKELSELLYVGVV